MKNILLFVILLILMGCEVTKLLTQGKSYSELSEIDIVNPVVNIGSIRKGNKVKFDQQASDRIESIITSYIPKHLKGKEVRIISLDGAVRKKYYQEVSKILKSTTRASSLKGVIISERLDSILLVNKIDCAMFVLVSGFNRSGNNYENQQMIGAVLGYAPIKASLLIRILIIDRKTRNVIFHRIVAPRNVKSLNEGQIRKAVTMLFDDYVSSKK